MELKEQKRSHKTKNLMTNAKTHTQKLNKFPLAYSVYLWSVPAVRTVCLLFLSGPAGQKYQSCRCCCRSLRRGCRPTNRTKNRFPQIKDDMILFLIEFLPLSHISSYQRRQLESSFYRFLRFPQIKADNQNCLFTAFSHFLKPKTTIRIVFLPLSPTWRPGCGPRRWNPCRTTARRPPRHQRR